MAMKQLTPELREALMADMMSFFDNSLTDEAIDEDETVNNENIDLGHDCPDNMKSTY